MTANDALYRKIALRILPILFFGYIIAYIDRVNVSFAKLQMLADLKFTESIYGLGAGIFFLGYFIFEVPSNLILHKVGARVWICRVLVTWGIISGCTALVRTPAEFYTMRLLLGVAEAGFFPGMILYLTYWFPSHRRAKMLALLMTGNPIAGIIGGPLSGAIMRFFERHPRHRRMAMALPPRSHPGHHPRHHRPLRLRRPRSPRHLAHPRRKVRRRRRN